MRFVQTLLAAGAIVAGVLAQKPTIDTSITTVQAGEPFEIEYSPKTATAKFVLRKGDSDDLKDVTVITENATGGKFTWNVPSTLVDDDNYALQIITDDGENYAGPARFEVTGGSGSESSSAASTAASTASSAKPSSGSTLITSAESSSASASVSPSGNSTVASATLSTGGSSRPTNPASSQTTTGGVPESTGAASSLSSSPIALIFGAVAAMAYFN